MTSNGINGDQRRRTQTNPNSLANLKPYKPGQSGNPRGRPTAGASIREAISILTDKDIEPAELATISRGEHNKYRKLGWRMGASAVLQALVVSKDGMKAIEFCADQTAGRPTQPLEHGVDETSPLQFIFKAAESDDE